MPLATPAFEVETFEFVEAGPGMALLRLAGTWRAGDPPEAQLVVYTGDDPEPVELEALPAPPAAGGVWRAAFSTDPELLRDPSARFELEPPAGREIALPAPVERGAGAEVEAEAAEPEPEPEPSAVRSPAPPRRIFGGRRLRSEAELRRALAAERKRAERAEAALRDELRGTLGQAAELLARIDGYEHSRVSFAQELDAVRRTHAQLVDELRAELETAKRELASAGEQLDTVHEAHSIELGGARRQRDAAVERHAEMKQELALAREEVDALHAQLADRDELLEHARAEAAAGARESAELHDGVERLRAALEARVRDASTPRRGSRAAAEEIDHVREQLDAGVERVAALERQAEALRDAIEAQLPASATLSPLQEALPLELLGAP
jgi:hypothetical protein